MSIFDEDGINSIIGDENLNENLNTDDLPSGSDGEEKQNDDEEEKVAIKVEPKKRSVRNTRPRLTIELLKGRRGIHTIENHFQDIKFQGKGHEKKDLNEILKRMQHWGHRLYPNYKFDDILKNVERLSKKKELQIYMNRYRQGQLLPDISPTKENADEVVQDVEEPFDEFDALLGEQIAISKTTTPTPHTPNSVRSGYSMSSSAFHTPKINVNAISSTPYHIDTPRTPLHNIEEEEIDYQPSKKQLTSDQLARIAENRRLAQQRRLAKIESLKPPI